MPRGFKLESRGDQCPRCGEGYYKSKFDIPLGAAPPHMVGKYKSCLKCDKDMKEICQLRISGPTQNSNNNRQQPAARANTEDRQPQNQPRKRKSDSFSDSSSKRQMPPPPPPSGSTGVVQCNCGQPAGSRVTQKSGVNQGRSFYTCDSRSCNFFQWTDQEAPAATSTNTQRQSSATLVFFVLTKSNLNLGRRVV